MRESPPAAGSGRYSTGSLIQDQLSKLDQVHMFERKYDPVSREIIEGLPIERRWRCLDIGAGAGSMAYWLAERVDEGSVLAIDVDVRYLDATRSPNLTVRQLDIGRAEFAAESFDLVFARAVFEHLPQRDALLNRIMRWLVPGGWLVAEDFYCLPSDDSPTAVGRALMAGYVKGLEKQGADMRWARRLPAALARIGLTSVGVRLTPAGPGQSASDDELIGLRLSQEGHALVAAGLVTADQLGDFVSSLGRGAWDMTTIEVSAWGQRNGGVLRD